MAKKFAVIGLGDFGTHLAIELNKNGAEVLAIDQEIERLENIKDQVTLTVKIDSSEIKPMQNQGLEKFDAVIVCIGDDFEASILTVAILEEIGIKRIIVRATTPTHERILRHLGIDEIILPTKEAAERLAYSLSMESVLDSFTLSDDYTIIESQAPKQFINKSLSELNLTQNFDVSVVTIKKIETRSKFLGIGTRTIERIIGIPSKETVIEQSDILVLFGKKSNIEKMLKSNQ